MEYLTAKELSERWRGRITVGTLKQWRWLKKGPAYRKFGNKVLYPLDAVVAFENNQTHRGES